MAAARKKKLDPKEGLNTSGLVYYTEIQFDTDRLKADINEMFNTEPGNTLVVTELVLAGKVQVKGVDCYRVVFFVKNRTNTVGIQTLDVRPEVMQKYLIG
jgi:hypothetical protein